MKEIIYTAIFIVLAIILGVLLFVMFGNSPKKNTDENPHKYKAGVYNSSISLNNNSFDVEVTVDADKIKSVSLVNLSESTAAAFPLMEPSFDSIVSQIYESGSLDNIEYSSDRKYTSEILINAIKSALQKAETS